MEAWKRGTCVGVEKTWRENRMPGKTGEEKRFYRLDLVWLYNYNLAICSTRCFWAYTVTSLFTNINKFIHTALENE